MRLARSPHLIPIFFLLSALAEFLQSIAVSWVAYDLTQSAFIVGALNAMVYLPGVIGGILLRNRADSGNATRLLSLTTLAIFTAATILAVVNYLLTNPKVLLAIFFAFFAVLSLVKMFNKAYIGRTIRQQFPPERGALIMSRATTATMIGGAIGAGLAGLALDLISATFAFALAAALYGLSFGIVTLIRNHPPQPIHPTATSPETTSATTPPTSVFRSRLLRTILLFSIPSSGAMVALSTILVPLAVAVAPGAATAYSALSVSSMIGGIIGGVLLSTTTKTSRFALNAALAFSGILFLALTFTDSIYATTALVFILSLTLTSHIVCMQVLTNQAPKDNQIGQFALIRNSVAGSAKVIFALAAGWGIQTFGLQPTTICLSLILGCAAGVWVCVARRGDGVVGFLG